ncbi:HECT-type E3 ubiquitin transferase [[Candida] zeylanoides]
MVNFTGQTKKRVVNLGGPGRALDRGRAARPLGPAGAAGAGALAPSFLEQSRASRLEREESRARERAAAVIQQYARRYLEMSAEHERVYREWVRRESVDDVWVAQLRFLCRWRRMSPAELADVLARVEGVVGELGPEASRAVATTVESILAKMAARRTVAVDGDCVAASARILLRTPQPQYHGLLDSLRELLPAGEARRDTVRLALAVNVADSLDGFVRFLAVPGVLEEATPQQVAAAKGHLDAAALDAAVAALPRRACAALLSNWMSRFEYTARDYAVVAAVLSRAAPAAAAATEVLYTPRFVNGALALLPAHPHTVLQTLSGLLWLSPANKTKVCMWVTLHRGTYRWLFDAIRGDATYRDVLALGEHASVAANMAHPFWHTVYTLEELYSYWLVVATDAEIFSEETLPRAAVVELMRFLKSLCLALSAGAGSARKLRDTSVALLNQLYTRNLRLEIVGADFWRLGDVTFNVDSMVQTMIEADRAAEAAAEGEESGEEGHGDAEDTDDSAAGSADAVGPADAAREPALWVLPPQAKPDILQNLPFFIPFKDRVRTFQALIERDRATLGAGGFSVYQTKLQADIRREHLLEDAFAQFHRAGANFKHTLSVTFYNAYGGQEAGIDGGGITKEFLTSVVAEAFAPATALFAETASHQLYPNPQVALSLQQRRDVALQQQRLQYLRFLGSVVGKCIYENVLIDAHFAPFFLTKWCNANRGNATLKNSINDLADLDPELSTNLMKLTSMSAAQLASMELTFVVDETVDGVACRFDLMGGRGEHTAVDCSNRLNYIHSVSNFKLNQSLHVQTRYFMAGLFEMVSSRWLSMFDARELQMLISGGEDDVDLVDWQANVEYGGYDATDLTVRLFWEVVAEMTSAERFRLVKFVTSVARSPLLGFGALSPRFGIRNAGYSLERLPTASTCVNLLKLPDYRDKRLLREKLTYAIYTDAGFDLS